MADHFDIPDKRSNEPGDYEDLNRRGQMKRSWQKGVQRQRDGRATLPLRDGLTWGSIGQLMGYLLGDVDDAFKNELFDQMLAQYKQTDRGSRLAKTEPLAQLLIGSWNIRYSAEEHTRRRINFLEQLDWDVLALQEVSRKAWKMMQESGIMEDGIYTLDGFGLKVGGKTPRGVAVIVRNGLKLDSPTLIPNLSQRERGISVQVHGLSAPIEVISWHAPNAASSGPDYKMAAYRAINEWLAGKETNTVLCFDGNHWNTNVSLKLAPYLDENHDFFEENCFFAANAQHNLQDTLLVYLRRNEAAYQKALQERPHGPLAVSHDRGTKTPKPDRLDYIFASPDMKVHNCEYDFAGATAAGSDHAIIIADLESTTKD